VYKTGGKITVLYILIVNFIENRREEDKFWIE